MPTLALVRGGEMVRSFRLDAPSIVVGRGGECDITLEGPLISRRHCQIAARGDGHVVEDLDSVNGTHVNGVAVTRQALRDGDRITVVPHVLVYHASDEELPPGPAAGEAVGPTGFKTTASVDTDEVNRHLAQLLSEASPYGFAVSHEDLGGGVDLVSVSGALDTHTADELEEAVNKLVVAGRCRFILDLTRVNYASSDGVAVLVWAARETEANGGGVVLLSPTDLVRESLERGFSGFFTTATDRREALSMLRPGG